MPDEYDSGDPTLRELLLKTHSVLIHASSEQEIIAALALCVSGPATLRLVYLDLDKTGLPARMRVTANWRGGDPWPEDPLLEHLLPPCPLIAALQTRTDPVWFVEDTPAEAALALSPFLGGAGRLAVIKLFGVAQVEQGSRWHSVAVVTWPQAGHFTREERYLLVSVCETMSAIVSHRRLYLESQENVKQLRRLDALKTEFLHTVSHELRTPLSGILTTADILLHGASGELTEEAQQDVQVILQSAQHLLDVITDILDMAQLQAGVLRITLEPVNLAQLIDETVQTIRVLAADKGLAVITTVDARLPTLQADKRRIRQVLLNLLSNAIKFSQQGAIQVEAHQEDSALVVSVQDEGIGIHPEDQAVVFEQFRRIDSLEARQAGGTGLGLPISKRLVELQGGQIWVTSEPGKGSTFYFSLPVEGPKRAHSIH